MTNSKEAHHNKKTEEDYWIVLQTDIYRVQNLSLEMPQQPSSKPQPQYWKILLDRKVHML